MQETVCAEGTYTRKFCPVDTDPFDTVTWKVFDATVKGKKGEIVFEQKGVEFPDFYTQNAVDVIASKYFFGKQGTPNREHSLKQLIGRVTTDIKHNIINGEYLQESCVDDYIADLTWLLLHQWFSFNSPVWFNSGVFWTYGVTSSARTYYYDQVQGKSVECDMYTFPQTSACFIAQIDDSIGSIFETASQAAHIFKGGSGIGYSLSSLRSKYEYLSGGGKSSGAMSFAKMLDSVGATIKSGGTTRRSATMQTMDITHPESPDFINAKRVEENKVRALGKQGYNTEAEGEAYQTVAFQDVNQSIRVNNRFMVEATSEEDENYWAVKNVTDDKWHCTGKTADEILDEIAFCCWSCGDPGVQFTGEIDRMHTVKNHSPIRSTNPCAEFVFVDNSACDLGSLNLLKFLDEDDCVNYTLLREATDVVFLALESLISFSSYPSPEIAENSYKLRPVGLGFANLGALLMKMKLPYDSDEGRTVAARVASNIGAQSALTSAWIAKKVGPYHHFGANKESHIKVVDTHHDSAVGLGLSGDESSHVWWKAIEMAEKTGFRNAQFTNVAPTGTIALMMDCDTSGIEPDYALKKYKKLSGGGFMTIANRLMGGVLDDLGYSGDDCEFIESHIMEKETVKGSGIDPEHEAIFHTANDGIAPRAHIDMMAAVQPFISGAISKTVNCPYETTVKEIRDLYVLAWKSGIKCLAIYRDFSKESQPLTTKKVTTKADHTKSHLNGVHKHVKDAGEQDVSQSITPVRRKLPDECESVRVKFVIADCKGYMHVGLFEDGTPGEVFFKMDKSGSTVSGLMNTVGILFSFCLQHGVPLKTVTDKLSYMRFEPHGLTTNQAIPVAYSLIDYLARYLATRFLGEKHESISDGPPCANCGGLTIRSGSCSTCQGCGSTTGCG